MNAERRRALIQDGHGLQETKNGENVLGVKKKAKLPKNLFRAVSATRRVMGGEDIDPDLQGMLDQVKGVGGRGCQRGF